MIRHHFEFRETIATVLADEQVFVEAACNGMIAARQSLELYLSQNPFFGVTLEPYDPESDLRTVTRMADAGKKAGVGPMAAVAGTIAWAGVEAMQDAGAEFGVIDNGGDIAMISDRELSVGVHAGTAGLSNRFAFIIPPHDEVLGICTSSATVGHSLSFGMADAVTVFSRNVSLADAWATSICNQVTMSVQEVFDRLIPGEITGVLVIIGNNIAAWGTLPRIIRADVDEKLITGGFSI